MVQSGAKSRTFMYNACNKPLLAWPQSLQEEENDVG